MPDPEGLIHLLPICYTGLTSIHFSWRFIWTRYKYRFQNS